MLPCHKQGDNLESATNRDIWQAYVPVQPLPPAFTAVTGDGEEDEEPVDQTDFVEGHWWVRGSLVPAEAQQERKEASSC